MYITLALVTLDCGIQFRELSVSALAFVLDVGPKAYRSSFDDD